MEKSFNLFISLVNSFAMRQILIIVFFIVLIGKWLIQIMFNSNAEEKNKIIEDDFSSYPTDEDGRYPWEYNIDDSPNSIPQNAKKYIDSTAPKRGRW